MLVLIWLKNLLGSWFSFAPPWCVWKTKINKIMFIKPGTAFEINIIIYKLRGYKSLKT